MGSIYKITNTVNGKVYIGQTSEAICVQRWIYHWRQYQNPKSTLPLYIDMRNFGIESFSFQVVEDNVLAKDLDAKEEMYIATYRSNNPQYGYNQTIGGKHSYNSFLTEHKVREIINDIIQHPELTLSEIGNKYKINRGLVSDINQGDIWRFSEYKYPIRLCNNRSDKLTSKEVEEIIDCLLNNESCVAISKKYSVSNVTISNINNGLIYKHTGISYPICRSANSKTRLTIHDVENIVTYLKETDLSYAQIGKIIGRDHHTVSNINSGNSYTEYLAQLHVENFPIRKI